MSYSNFCERCNIWPDDMKEHMKTEHPDGDSSMDQVVERIDEIIKVVREKADEVLHNPKIYIRLVDYPYDSTIIQVISTDVENAFNFVPHDDHAVETEIQVWQGGERIELWMWDVNGHSFVQRSN